jgi:ATP-binding protein involved in chromosome partitioning
MNRKKKRPAKIELDHEKGDLVIVWKDGDESRFALAELRRNCPCAVCRDLRARNDVETGELKLLDGEAATATAAARDFVYVGRYGIRITWADGHDTGIYTFEALRQQDEEAG